MVVAFVQASAYSAARVLVLALTFGAGRQWLAAAVLLFDFVLINAARLLAGNFFFYDRRLKSFGLLFAVGTFVAMEAAPFNIGRLPVVCGGRLFNALTTY